MALRPLSGKIIVVTRPKKQADGLVEKLRSAGADVIEAPLIRIAPPKSYGPLDGSLKRLESFDAVIFTSANAAEAFLKRSQKIGLGLPARPKRLFAIGPQTAQTLRRYGWAGARSPRTYRGEELAESLGRVKGWRILIPRAEIAREILPAALEKRGAKVILVDAYRTVADPIGLKVLKDFPLRTIDAVIFTSTSTATRFVEGLGKSRCRRLFKIAAAASIGPITSAALSALGIKAVVQARRATANSLFKELEAHFKKP